MQMPLSRILLPEASMLVVTRAQVKTLVNNTNSKVEDSKTLDPIQNDNEITNEVSNVIEKEMKWNTTMNIIWIIQSRFI